MASAQWLMQWPSIVHSLSMICMLISTFIARYHLLAQEGSKQWGFVSVCERSASINGRCAYPDASVLVFGGCQIPEAMVTFNTGKQKRLVQECNALVLYPEPTPCCKRVRRNLRSCAAELLLFGGASPFLALSPLDLSSDNFPDCLGHLV
jgi:hypothetical protein